MARKTRDEEVLTLESEMVPVEPTVPQVVRAPSMKKIKKVSFETWAKQRGVKSHHMGGMRAFVPNIELHRPLEVWDSIFADY